MPKFSEIIGEFNTKKRAKKYWRTYEQQEYRDKLAKALKKDRTLKKKQKTLKQKDIINKIEAWYPQKYILWELDKNRWLLDNEMIKEMIEVWYWWFIIKNLEKLKELDTSVVIKLIEKWLWVEVVMNLEKFKWIKYEEIANKLIKIWHPEYVANNIEKFGKLNKNIAKKLIKKWYGDIVDKYPEKF